jgi:hypothetical protein
METAKMTRVIPFEAAANETVSHPIILSRQQRCRIEGRNSEFSRSLAKHLVY